MDAESRVPDKFEELIFNFIREAASVASTDNKIPEFRWKIQSLRAVVGERLRDEDVVSPKIALFVLGVLVLPV
jgi:hypothetical protein